MKNDLKHYMRNEGEEEEEDQKLRVEELRYYGNYFKEIEQFVNM
jgi:hypothetical protein